MSTPAAAPFDAMVEVLLRGVIDDVKTRLVDGARQTLDGMAQSATRKLGSAAAGVTTGVLQRAGSTVLLDQRFTLRDAAEVAVVFGRRAPQATPLTASAIIPPGRYRAVVMLVPEE